MQAGVKGESIVNTPVTMKLVDGHDLYSVIVRVVNVQNNLEELIGQLIKSTVPYDYKTIFSYLLVDPSIISGPKSSWNLKDIMENIDDDWSEYV